MMKKLFVALFVVCGALAAFGQTRQRLAILPFTGGTDRDGAAIATIFSYQHDIRRAFDIIPAGKVDAVLSDWVLWKDGYADSDTLTGIGSQLGADFLICGHIHGIGDRNLVVTTIYNVDTFELLAGDCLEYTDIEEIPALLPDILSIIISASFRDTARLPSLAIVPFNIANRGMDNRDAEILSRILAVEIANTGRYIVLPRSVTMQKAFERLNIQPADQANEQAGAPDERDDETEEPLNAVELKAALGKSINADYVLSAEFFPGEYTVYCSVLILDTENERYFSGGGIRYGSLVEGITEIADLARFLAGKTQPYEPTLSERFRTHMLDDTAKFWSVGASAGSSFAAPWIIFTVHGTAAPFRNSFFDAGCDFGFITGLKGAGYHSFYPYVHYNYLYPLFNSGSVYAGGGFGIMLASYQFDDLRIPLTFFAVDICAGYIFRDFLDISYTLRTNFTSVSNKVSVGYVWRFR